VQSNWTPTFPKSDLLIIFRNRVLLESRFDIVGLVSITVCGRDFVFAEDIEDVEIFPKLIGCQEVLLFIRHILLLFD
jgi:hypothetical protein